jgi:aminoglycoside phosphotransferase (APT) family kinase protein
MTWPEDRVRSADVREWICSQIPDCEAVDGPTVVYRVNGWSLTARFVVKQRTPRADPRSSQDGSVVCKTAFSPEDATAPHLHRVLQACGTGHVPKMLAWQGRGNQTWLLFAPFEGRVIRDLGDLAPVVKMARTLARIQLGVAALPPGETAGILRLPVEQIPALLEEMLQGIRDKRLCFKEGEPLISYEELASHRDHVARWAGELSAGEWPESIDHPDLHINNAVLLDDGRVLIYDWESATLGCPFFSMDHLLESMQGWKSGPGDLAPARQEGGLAYTPNQVTVRRAYLEEFPGGTLSEREQAFDAAMCLSQVFRAYQHVTFFESLETDYLERPEGRLEKHATIAGYLEEALRRWVVMLQQGVPRSAPQHLPAPTPLCGRPE